MSENLGSAILGHPANAIPWLVASGVTLEPGDLVSLVSIGPHHASSEAKSTATVTYTGLPGKPDVSVTFTE